MLTGLYITLRFGHFISLMLAFGCVLYGAWWAVKLSVCSDWWVPGAAN